MFRFLILLFTTCGLALPALAEPIYFISVATISKGKQTQYDSFLKAVSPIWKKHKMQVLLRSRIVDMTAVGGVQDHPHEIGVLRAASRADFKAYLSDVAYQKIKGQRLEAVDTFVVLEGVATQTAALKYLKNVPMAAIVLSTGQAKPSKVSLTIKVQLVGQVKGPISSFLKSVTAVQVHAVSYDDNPMGYMPDNKSSDGALGLVGELVR
ncbi:MAG: hypothetical protein V3V02_09490 [Rhizobiaceae bacterium]